MSFLLSPICNEQQVNQNGDPLSGGTIETYLAGTSTPAPTYTSISGAVPQANPIVLNVLGLAPSPIWLDSNLTYKFIVKDALGVVQRTIDDISGVSSSVPIQDQWIIFTAPATFINATSFSVAGDQTNIFQMGRRIRTINTGGVIYSTIISSIFGAVTTVTISSDSGGLDAGLSQVSYGLLSTLNSSIPDTIARASFTHFTSVPIVTTGGVAPNYTLTSPDLFRFPSPFVLATGMRFRIKIHASSGFANNTLNINGSGAKILGAGGIGVGFLPAIQAGAIYDVEYDGTDFAVLNPLQYDPTGEYFFWPTGVTPGHGLLCNGAAVSRSTYARLFAKISTNYGVGDGSTTFNVPNVPAGYTLINVPGSEGGTTVGQVITHSHNILTEAIGVAGAGVRRFVDPAGVTVSTTQATGGGINQPASMFARLCIRF